MERITILWILNDQGGVRSTEARGRAWEYPGGHSLLNRTRVFFPAGLRLGSFGAPTELSSPQTENLLSRYSGSEHSGAGQNGQVY